MILTALGLQKNALFLAKPCFEEKNIVFIQFFSKIITFNFFDKKMLFTMFSMNPSHYTFSK